MMHAGMANVKNNPNKKDSPGSLKNATTLQTGHTSLSRSSRAGVREGRHGPLLQTTFAF